MIYPSNMVCFRYVSPLTFFSNTKGPINLSPITPHHTFTENLLWKVVTVVACGLSCKNHIQNACRNIPREKIGKAY